MAAKARKPKITAKQEGGNDGYCYVIRVDGKVYRNGLTRAELPFWKAEALKAWTLRQIEQAAKKPTANEVSAEMFGYRD